MLIIALASLAVTQGHTLRWGRLAYVVAFPLGLMRAAETGRKMEKAGADAEGRGGGRTRNIAAPFAPNQLSGTFWAQKPSFLPSPTSLALPRSQGARRKGGKKTHPQHFFPRFPVGSRATVRGTKTVTDVQPDGLFASSCSMASHKNRAAKRPTVVRPPPPPPPLLLTVPGFQAAESLRHNKTSQSARTP